MREVFPIRAPGRAEPERPRLELSGPKLKLAFERLVSSSEELGGVERFVEALNLKSKIFRQALGEGRAQTVELRALKGLCSLVSPVRRRMSAYLEPASFEQLRARIARLLEGIEDTSRADERIGEFCGAFPEDRAHRWVRDLAAELLHNVDPERYPLMCRWVWDARTNTGVLREIWHAEDADHIAIEVADRYGTFVMLREELAQFLSSNGVFRDVLWYVDLLTAQVYAAYVSEQGGSYLRTDFSAPDDPLQYTRRLLGLDGVGAGGRTRLKTSDGEAPVLDDLKLPD
jgi:hypothetical protein